MIATLLDRIRKPKRRRALDEIFVPVIFANGRDDDLPGVIAAVENRAVLYDDRVYRPGEALDVIRRRLCLSCDRLFVSGDDKPVPPAGWEHDPPRCVVIREARPARKIPIQDCHILMGARPAP